VSYFFVYHNAMISIIPAGLRQGAVVAATLAPSISLGNARARRGAARVTGWDGSVGRSVGWSSGGGYGVCSLPRRPGGVSTCDGEYSYHSSNQLQAIARQSLLTTLHYNSYTAHREELPWLLVAGRLSYLLQCSIVASDTFIFTFNPKTHSYKELHKQRNSLILYRRICEWKL
jgi:hypothetical protein